MNVIHYKFICQWHGHFSIFVRPFQKNGSSLVQKKRVFQFEIKNNSMFCWICCCCCYFATVSKKKIVFILTKYWTADRWRHIDLIHLLLYFKYLLCTLLIEPLRPVIELRIKSVSNLFSVCTQQQQHHYHHHHSSRSKSRRKRRRKRRACKISNLSTDCIDILVVHISCSILR